MKRIEKNARILAGVHTHTHTHTSVLIWQLTNNRIKLNEVKTHALYVFFDT